MRKMTMWMLVGALGMANFGCVMVLGVSDRSDRPRIVEIEGEHYVVDEQALCVRRIDDRTEAADDGSVEIENQPAQD